MPQPTPQHPAAYPVLPIVNALNRDADRPLVEMAGGRAWTGGEVRDAISQYAQALTARGIGVGARVALLATNCIEVLILHLSLIHI